MTHEHSTARSLARRLRPSPERFAGAAALYKPSLLLALRASQPHPVTSPRLAR
jgi:hypothetical protein